MAKVAILAAPPGTSGVLGASDFTGGGCGGGGAVGFGLWHAEAPNISIPVNTAALSVLISILIVGFIPLLCSLYNET